MRKPLIAGNWKLQKTIPEAAELTTELKSELADFTGADLLVCPPFIDLGVVGREISGSSIELGAQDIFWEDTGAWYLLNNLGQCHCEE